MSGRAIRIALLGMGDRVRQRLELLFERNARGAAVVVNESVAEAVMVDLDTPGASGELAEYRLRHPDHAVLVLAVSPPPLPPGDEPLTKPIRIADLLQALDRLQLRITGMEGDPASTIRRPGPAVADPTPSASRMVARVHRVPEPTAVPSGDPPVAGPSGAAVDRPLGERTERLESAAAPPDPRTRWSALCGERDDIDPSDIEAVRALWVPTAARLLGDLVPIARRARRERIVVNVSWERLSILLDGVHDHAMSNRDAESLSNLCRMPYRAGSVAVTTLSDDTVAALAAARAEHWPTLDALVWSAALWTFRGGLPSGETLDERIFLSQWPNLTRLAALPDAMRIAALWVEQPMSIAFTAEALKVPQRHVIAFYGAAHALGIAGRARRASDALVEPAPVVPSKQRPIVARLFQHLQSLVGRDRTQRARTAGRGR
ncbi:MAG: hypothetical protein H6983_07820 [Ectothiorhodospiraceae bacterium]|nr:hypothetical protein [Chromatiales bacterium]MCP5154054.1 hypothetical protein [Ectothiorhodospiraceae bacterium]